MDFSSFGFDGQVEAFLAFVEIGVRQLHLSERFGYGDRKAHVRVDSRLFGFAEEGELSCSKLSVLFVQEQVDALPNIQCGLGFVVDGFLELDVALG